MVNMFHLGAEIEMASTQSTVNEFARLNDTVIVYNNRV